MHIAVIPARSGSKGLKDKNIKLLQGKPLLAYTIEAAKASGIYDIIHVSTDSEEYGKIARQYGADVPFLRSPELSSDTASSWDAIRYVLTEYEKRGMKFSHVTVLQPTSPCRTAEDITNSWKLMEEKEADSIVGICQVDHSPLWSNVLPEDESLYRFLTEETLKQRQGLPTYYRINGAMYMMKSEVLKGKDTDLYGEKSYAYVMPKERSIDIDDELDFIVAEAVIGRRNGV